MNNSLAEICPIKRKSSFSATSILGLVSLPDDLKTEQPSSSHQHMCTDPRHAVARNLKPCVRVYVRDQMRPDVAVNYTEETRFSKKHHIFICLSATNISCFHPLKKITSLAATAISLPAISSCFMKFIVYVSDLHFHHQLKPSKAHSIPLSQLLLRPCILAPRPACAQCCCAPTKWPFRPSRLCVGPASPRGHLLFVTTGFPER